MSKEKKHRARYVAAGIIIAAMLGGISLGFGTGLFRVPATGETETQNSPPQTPAQAPTPEPTQDLRFIITVSESDIEFEGQSITLEALREQLLESYTGVEIYELRDDHAIKSMYDSLKSLLEDIGVPYIEK